jgi:hypothetical protein
VAWLTAIEKGDLDRLPDMIHLRKCVGIFAQEVGLDPDSVSARYMAQLPGRSALDEFESEESSSDSIDLASLKSGFAVDPTREFPTEPTVTAVDGPRDNDVEEDWRPEAHESRLRRIGPGAPMSWGHTGYAALMAVTLITLSIGFWESALRLKPRGKPDATASSQLPDAQRQAAPDAARRDNAVSESAGSPHDDLGGSWMLTSRVENSSLRSYDDLTLGFRLQLAQEGNRVRGQGLKWIENGRPIASRARTPITVEGTIDEGRLVLAFTERGIRRISRGTLHMQVADNGTLQGRFSTDAARSSGRARAVRLVSQHE